MFFRDPYKDQLVKRIETLIAGGNFEKANNLCLEVLEKEPDDADMIRLVALIEQRVQSENEKRIDDVLQELEPLWKQAKYLEIIQRLTDVKKYSKDYAPLLQAMSKAQSEYRKIAENNAKEEFKKIEVEFEELLKENRLDEVVSKCIEIENSQLKTPEMLAMADKFKLKVVDIQLNNSKDLIKSDNYDEALSYLENLKNIAPRYEKLHNIIEETKFRRVNNISAEHQETAYKAVNNVKDLLRLEKYEEAYQAAQELVVYNPNSKIAKQLLKESESKFNNQLRDETVAQIEKDKPALKDDYQKNKDNYKRI